MLCYSIVSCHKDRIEEFQSVNLNPQSLETEEGSEGLMEFAPATPNPYTLANMQLALNELYAHNQMDCDTSIFNIRVTHEYIKFIPADSAAYIKLIQDSTLILFDYPLDRKLTKAGTYYRDSSLSEGQPNYQWACVIKNKELPDVPYEILAELYLPEEDPELTQYDGTEYDACITLLIDEALKLTGNYDTLDHLENMTSGGELFLSLPNKWTPSGTIRMEDNTFSPATSVNLRGVKVHARRWFEIREAITDINGNFNVGHQFRYPVNYTIKWERGDFEIRHKRVGQAYFNGPEQKSSWNLNISSGYSRLYAIIHRAAHRYYYEAIEDLARPPRKNEQWGRMTIGAYDWDDVNLNGQCIMARKVLSLPEIKIFKRNHDCEEIFSTTLHELAHASHWNLVSHTDYYYFQGSPSSYVVHETFAVGISYALTRLEYPLHKGKLYDNPDYSNIIMDLIDNPTMEGTSTNKKNKGWNNWQGDSVTDYTIKQIQDALVGEKTLYGWRDNLKDDTNNATENNVNAVFDHWW